VGCGSDNSGGGDGLGCGGDEAGDGDELQGGGDDGSDGDGLEYIGMVSIGMPRLPALPASKPRRQEGEQKLEQYANKQYHMRGEVVKHGSRSGTRVGQGPY